MIGGLTDMAGKRIEFSFVGDASDLERALRSVQSEGREAGDEMESAGKRGAAGLSNAEKASKALKAGLGAIAVAAAAAAVATSKIVGAAVDLAKRADEIAKRAKAIGTTAEELQILTGALELGGVQAETTANAIQKLSVNLGMAAKGSKMQVEALEDLGLTFEQLDRVPLDERIALIADGLGTMTSQSKRAQTAQALLGRGALDMLAAFTEGGDAIRESSKLIEDAGIISNETARQGEDLADALTLLKRRANALRDDALAPMLPVLTKLSDGLSEAMGAADPEQIEGLSQAFSRTMLDVVAPLLVIVTRGSGKAALSIGVLGSAMALAAQAALAMNPALWRTLGAVRALTLGNLSLARSLMEDATDGMFAVGQSFDELMEQADSLGFEIGAIDLAAESMLEVIARASAEIGKLGEETTKATKSAGGMEEELDDIGTAAEGAAEGLSDLVDTLTDFGSFDRALAAAGETFSEFADRLIDEDLFDEALDLTPRFSAEDAESARQQAISLAQDVANATLDIMSQVSDQILADRTAAAEETADRLKDVEKRIAGAATETERERLFEHRNMLKARQAAQKEEVLEAWHVSQAFAISQAVINAAAGIAMQLAGTPGPPAFVLAAIAGAMGAAQVAAIAAEPPPQFHAGGMISSQMRAHDEVNIRARAGEAVLSPQGVAAAGGAGGVNALNAGGGAGGANVTVFQVGHRAVDAMIHESLRRPGGRLTRELRAVRPRRVGRYNPYRS